MSDNCADGAEIVECGKTKRFDEVVKHQNPQKGQTNVNKIDMMQQN